MREFENLSKIFAALFEAVGVLGNEFHVVLAFDAWFIARVMRVGAFNAVLQPYALGHEYFCACVVKLVGIRKKREIQALFDCFAAVRS